MSGFSANAKERMEAVSQKRTEREATLTAHLKELEVRRRPQGYARRILTRISWLRHSVQGIFFRVHAILRCTRLSVGYFPASRALTIAQRDTPGPSFHGVGRGCQPGRLLGAIRQRVARPRRGGRAGGGGKR